MPFGFVPSIQIALLTCRNPKDYWKNKSVQCQWFHEDAKITRFVDKLPGLQRCAPSSETGRSCSQQSPCFKEACNFLFLSLAFPHCHTHPPPRGMSTHEPQMELSTSAAQLPPPMFHLPASISQLPSPISHFPLPAQPVSCEPSWERDGSGELSDNVSRRKAEKNELRTHLGYTLGSSIHLKVQHLCYCDLFRGYGSQLPNHMLESTALRFTKCAGQTD